MELFKSVCNINGKKGDAKWEPNAVGSDFWFALNLQKCVCWCSTVHFSFFRPCFFPIHRRIVRIPCSSLCRCHIVFNFANDATESLVWVYEFHFKSRRWLHRVVQSRRYDTAEFRKRFLDCTYNVAEHIKSFWCSVPSCSCYLFSLLGFGCSSFFFLPNRIWKGFLIYLPVREWKRYSFGLTRECRRWHEQRRNHAWLSRWLRSVHRPVCRTRNLLLNYDEKSISGPHLCAHLSLRGSVSGIY